MITKEKDNRQTTVHNIQHGELRSEKQEFHQNPGATSVDPVR